MDEKLYRVQVHGEVLVSAISKRSAEWIVDRALRNASCLNEHSVECEASESEEDESF